MSTVTYTIIIEGRVREDIVKSELRDADLTTAQSITLDTKGKRTLEVYAYATAATTFHLDASNDGTNWIEDVHMDTSTTTNPWASVTRVNEGFFNSYRYVRLRSEAAGSSGDKVTLILVAK